ncbi:helix-turn-helix domain-containing protein [Sulfitobacter sp. M22]|uniref:helix-turn-helix domain-containing protein n=1 Tax=Sulfitobacter sp. M22 TaxID=2675332 RepID=UPI001F41969F|nr:helix-turn-helix transcriptional regulator [Sulfitobacter sp. M22]MCF7728692.1 helix-turn-helix domain-containing protein [Sulfitobacter sp. M22]
MSKVDKFSIDHDDSIFLKRRFGEILKVERLNVGLSQQELAEKLGYKSAAQISAIESGDRQIPHRDIVRFGLAVKVQPSTIALMLLQFRYPALQHALSLPEFDLDDPNNRYELLDVFNIKKRINVL